jgi:hypothetical protein
MNCLPIIIEHNYIQLKKNLCKRKKIFLFQRHIFEYVKSFKIYALTFNKIY